VLFEVCGGQKVFPGWPKVVTDRGLTYSRHTATTSMACILSHSKPSSEEPWIIHSIKRNVKGIK
jgi:hypothetical protein